MAKHAVAVTFESDTQAPRTWRGEVEGAGIPSTISKALRLAKSQFKGARYDSLCIIVDKLRAGNPVERETE